MALPPVELARARCEREREQLAAQERPAPRIRHKVQRAAAKALAVFFVLMLALTLLSRAADSVTVARVETEAAKTGILTNRTTATGSITAQGDLELTLPGGIRVNRIAVEKGTRVQAGDVLLELDQEGIEAAVRKLEDDLRILDLKIAGVNRGQSGADTDAILNARAALGEARITLENAQADLERLTRGRVTAEDRTVEDLKRAQEDLERAQEDYETAVVELSRAEVKAKEEIVKAAQEKVDAAAEALADVKESAAEAVNSAEQAVKSAEEQRNSSTDQYWSAMEGYNRARDQLARAQIALDEAVAGGDEAAIAAARELYIQAQESLNSAQRSLAAADNMETSGSNTVSRAKDNLKSTKEKWEAKVKKAEEELARMEEKLAEAKLIGDVSGEAVVIAAKSAVDSAQRGVDSAQRSVDSAKRAVEDAGLATEEQLLTAQRAVETAQRGVETAQRGVESAERQASAEQETQRDTGRQNEIERLGYVSERREVKRKLEALRAVAGAGGVLTAPVAGVVLEILEQTGLTQEGTRVAVLSRSDMGFEFMAKLPQEEAEELSVGTEGTLTFTQDGKSVERKATVTALGMADEDGNVTLTAALPQGTYPTGASAKLEVTHRSEQYASCLPLGALRSDGGDKFVLVLREKQTVMGTEQTVVKVPVTVLDQDSERVAVEGLGWDDQVVVSAGKPISEGDRVRVESAP